MAPTQKSNKDKIEKVQRRAARFVSNNFRRKASVSEMLHNLGWQSLDGRRQDQRLVLFYKIINGLMFSLARSFVDYASAVWYPHQKFNQVKLEMVQRRAARIVKSRYKRTDSVTAMLDELGWPILSKRRKDARLILFYKIINNLAQVPHEHILTKAYEGTRKKNNHKFRHIAVSTSQYRQSFFPKTVGPWNQLSFADSPTLENFRTNLLSTNRP